MQARKPFHELLDVIRGPKRGHRVVMGARAPKKFTRKPPSPTKRPNQGPWLPDEDVFFNTSVGPQQLVAGRRSAKPQPQQGRAPTIQQQHLSNDDWEDGYTDDFDDDNWEGEEGDVKQQSSAWEGASISEDTYGTSVTLTGMSPLLVGLPDQELMASGLMTEDHDELYGPGSSERQQQQWQSAFLSTARQRRAAVAARRAALFGPGWRQRDVRLYLTRRGLNAAAHAALMSEAAPQLASAAAAASVATKTGTTPGSTSPQFPRQAPIPRLSGMPRQRGGGPFDDSLPTPRALLALPSRWRRRVLAERVVAARVAEPRLSPAAVVALYTRAPLMLCWTTAAVVAQLRGVARALGVSLNAAAAQVGSHPWLGVVGPDALSFAAATLTARYGCAWSSGGSGGGGKGGAWRRGSSGVSGGGGGQRGWDGFRGTADSYRFIAFRLASSVVLYCTPPHVLMRRIEVLAHATRCSEAQAARVVLSWPSLAAALAQPGNRVPDVAAGNLALLADLLSARSPAGKGLPDTGRYSSSWPASGSSSKTDSSSSSSSSGVVHQPAGLMSQLQAPDLLLVPTDALLHACGVLVAAGVPPGLLARSLLHQGLAGLPPFLLQPSHEATPDLEASSSPHSSSTTRPPPSPPINSIVNEEVAPGAHRELQVAVRQLYTVINQAMGASSSSSAAAAAAAAAGAGILEECCNALTRGEEELLRCVVASGSGVLLALQEHQLQAAYAAISQLLVLEPPNGDKSNGSSAADGESSDDLEGTWGPQVAHMWFVVDPGPELASATERPQQNHPHPQQQQQLQQQQLPYQQHTHLQQQLCGFLASCPWVLLRVHERLAHRRGPRLNTVSIGLGNVSLLNKTPDDTGQGHTDGLRTPATTPNINTTAAVSHDSYVSRLLRRLGRLPDGKPITPTTTWLQGPHPLAGTLQASLLRRQPPPSAVISIRDRHHQGDDGRSRDDYISNNHNQRLRLVLEVIGPALEQLRHACGLRTAAAAWLLWLCWPRCIALNPPAAGPSTTRGTQLGIPRVVVGNLPQSARSPAPNQAVAVVVDEEVMALDEVQRLIRRLAAAEAAALTSAPPQDTSLRQPQLKTTRTVVANDGIGSEVVTVQPAGASPGIQSSSDKVATSDKVADGDVGPEGTSSTVMQPVQSPGIQSSSEKVATSGGTDDSRKSGDVDVGRRRRARGYMRGT